MRIAGEISKVRKEDFEFHVKYVRVAKIREKVINLLGSF